jgi:hydroxyacylglutathione hydrolase
MDVELILTPGLGNGAFLITGGRDAVVVDPPRDAWRVVAAAEARGWRVTHVLETHVHNDYLSGALELRSSLGTEILAPARGRYAFAHRPMDDADILEIDGLRLAARATPGHTPEHLAWEVWTEGDTAPSAIATGGSLLVGSAGRTDLLGADQTDELTRAQFHSLRALATLPDDVAVLPTHGAGSFCSVGPADAARMTTIGRERRSNPLLGLADETAFRTALLDGLGPYPTYYAEMGPINRAGPVVVGRLEMPPEIGSDAVRAAVAGGAHVVDARSREAFAAGHIGGSLNIELGDTFASYVGWFVPFGAAVVLILPDPFEDALVEATTQLFRIGYDRIVGVLAGGVMAWADAGGTVASYPVVSAAATAEELGRGARPNLLDVRYP